MMTSIRGIHHRGKIELLEPAPDIAAAQVIITFLPKVRIKLADLGISPEQAAAMRAGFGAIAEDWDDPEMDVYDSLGMFFEEDKPEPPQNQKPG